MLTGLAPVVAVLVAVGVALVQAYLQQTSLKYSLFDKRYEVYRAVDTFLAGVFAASGTVSNGSVHKFRAETAHAEFLFNKDVLDFINSVSGKALELASISTVLP
ncbi:MAG: hypothetical protein ABSH49_31015 [Bryobacteraceae bacterium]|jgi:hypothetical protein